MAEELDELGDPLMAEELDEVGDPSMAEELDKVVLEGGEPSSMA
jgi:hypothetical protein